MDDDTQSRFLLALALSMVVLLVWMRYLAPKPEPVEPEQQVGKTTAAPAEVGAPQAPETVPAVPQRPERATEAAAARPEDVKQARDIVLETPLVRATFTTLGGRLRSLRLNKYEAKEGGSVELVPPAELTGKTRLPLGIAIPGPNVTDNPDAYLFEATVTDHTVTMERLLDCGLRVRKEFRFKEDAYTVDAAVTFANETSEILYIGQDERPSYEFAWEPAIGDPASQSTGRWSIMGPIWKGEKTNATDKSRKPREFRAWDGQWVGIKSRYFAAVIRPEAVPAVVEGQPVGEKGQRVAVAAASFQLEPDEAHTDRYELFMGPMELGMLRSLGHDYQELVNFGMFSPVSIGMLWILRTSYRVIPNYGVAIILLTILARVLLYPLNHKSMQTMKKMRALQPALKELEEKYKDKPQERAKKMMQLQRQHGVSMFGGCLPMLVQFPIWIALFRTLSNAIELRGAPFALWIKDLSAPETLFELPFSLPFLGNELHLLPLLMAAIMLVQQKMMPMASSSQADSQKMMMIMMPVMMGVLFYHMPSGLCLYIMVSTLLGVVQQWLVYRGMKSEPEPVKTVAARKR